MDTEEFHALPGSELVDRFGYRECATGQKPIYPPKR